MARCTYRTIGDIHPHRRAWADFSSDDDEEPEARAFRAPVPPTLKAEETDSNSSLEVTRGGSGSEVDFSADPDHLSLEEPAESPEEPQAIVFEPENEADDEVQVVETASASQEPEEPEELRVSEAPERARAIEEALKMARLLRQFSAHSKERSEAAVETSLQSQDVVRLKGLREKLLAQRRAKETQGLLPVREVHLEATRAKVAKLQQELSDALKTREMRAQQEAEELLALRESDAVQVVEPQCTPEISGNEELKAELQRLQAENQELLRAAQQVRNEDTGSQKQVQVLQAEVKKLKATLQEYRESTSEMELQLAEAQKSKASKMETLQELQAKRQSIEEEHRILERKVQAEKTRSQELESEKVSLQYSVKEAEEACRVWQWRLRKELCQIEKTEPNSNFVQQLLHKAPEVAKVEG